MPKFRDFSIKRKLTVIILLTTCLLLLLTSAAFISTELVSVRREMISNISTLAEVIGINSTAALTFQDSQTAREILAGLTAEPHVMSACIYTDTGDVFATYNNEKLNLLSPNRHLAKSDLFEKDTKFSRLTEEAFRFSNEYLEVVRPIVLNGKHIGQVYVCTDLKALYSRLKWFVGTVAGVMLVSLLLAYLMSSKLQRIISRPISTLSQTMTIVSSERDYTVRARKEGNDEIGVLIDGFNDMIRQIQREIEERKRAEEALRKTHDELEERVEERTAELVRINDALKREIEERKRIEQEILEKQAALRAQNITTVRKSIELSDIKRELEDKNYDLMLSSAELEKAMEALRKARDELEIRVEERTRELAKANEELKAEINERKRMEQERAKLEAHLRRAEKMEALGTLAGGVAHDLNNILSGLVSYPELLLLDLAEDSPLRRPILIMQNSGNKAAAIVQDLLTLARRGVPAADVVNLNDIISDYLRSPENAKLRAFHRSVRFVTNLEKDLLNILGSSVHLSKTVMNLISNAAEALPDGGTVTISTRNQYIDKPIRGYDEVKEGDYVVLSVADNGTGISAEDLERIFEPFYTKKAMGRSGTGLGMAVVWGTVRDHRGYIDVQSTVGKGTTFALYFPVTRKEAERGKSTRSIEEYMGHGETILVIDDVREQREIASVMLRKLGYTVNTVSSGEEAIEYMKNGSADLLILDMIMDPGIDGLETYRRILELHPGQKAIIASGFSETDRVREAQRLGAGQYIKKPYTLEKIGLTVKAESAK